MNYPVRTTCAAVTVIAVFASLTACSSTHSSPDVLRYGLSSAPTCADPAQASTNQTVNVTRQVVDSLVDQNPRTGAITPWLATTFSVSPDARSFTFTLRTDVTFSDRTPLTSSVVRENFDALAHPAKSGGRGASRTLQASGFLLGYQGTETPNPHTAIVRFADPNAQFLQAAATTQLGILAHSTLVQSFDQRCTATNVVGSGPYVYSGWKQNRSVTFSRRSQYHWVSPIGLSDVSRYQTLQFDVIPEPSVRTGSIQSGQLDAIADVTQQDRSALISANVSVVDRPNPGLPYVLQPNVSHGVLADQAVRNAVTTALNRPELVDAALGDGFKPATSVLASTTPGYAVQDFIRHDRNASERVLDARGWRRTTGGIRANAGKRLTFDVIYSPEFYANKPVLEIAQQQLRDVGIDMRITALSNDSFLSRRAAGDFDALYYNVTRADPDILRSRLGSTGTNYSHRSADPGIDPLLERQAGTADVGDRNRLVADIQARLIGAGYAIPIVELSQIAAVARGYDGVGFDASGVLRVQFRGK